MHYKVRKAVPADVEDIYVVLSPYASDGLILKRERDDILQNINNFLVAVKGNSIIGVISYYDYGKSLKEIRSLASRRLYSKSGIGSRLVAELIKILLKDEPPPKIFALSFSPGFFKKIGFIEVEKATLPEKIWKDCDNCQYKGTCGETALVYVNEQ